MIFRTYFLKRKIQSILKGSPARKPRFRSLNESETFLISFNIRDKEAALKCAAQLTALNKNVIFSVLIPRKPKNADYHIDPSWFAVKEDELDQKGFPTPAVSQAFGTLEADTLIDLTRTGDFVMHYLQLQHPAAFKVGTTSFLKGIFDLTITRKEKDDIVPFFEHILFYLRTIRSN
jgi:hypothetical protein